MAYKWIDKDYLKKNILNFKERVLDPLLMVKDNPVGTGTMKMNGDIAVTGKITNSTSGETYTTQEYVDNALTTAMKFKGTIGATGTIQSLPEITAEETYDGWAYKVITKGTYDGRKANIGDMFISNGTVWVWVSGATTVDAENVHFDNTDTSLSSTDVQAAIIEVSQKSSGVSIEQKLTSGTEIADITVGTTTTKIYSPTPATKLSELSDDETHRLVTDEQISKWDSGSGGVQSDWDETDTTAADYIKNKPTIPTKTSELTNDSGYTSNEGTVTSVAVEMNGEVKGTVTDSGTIDLGTVITDISGKENVKEITLTDDGWNSGHIYLVNLPSGIEHFYNMSTATYNSKIVPVCWIPTTEWDSASSKIMTVVCNNKSVSATFSRYSYRKFNNVEYSMVCSKATDLTDFDRTGVTNYNNINNFYQIDPVLVSSSTIMNVRRYDGDYDNSFTYPANSFMMFNSGKIYSTDKDKVAYNLSGSTYESKEAAEGGTDLSLVTTGEKYAWNNSAGGGGTVTSVSVEMNGEVKGTVTDSGTIDLGTVITEHQDISGKQDRLSVTGTATKPIYVSADGTVSECTYELNKTVPTDAVFTDTVTTVTTSGEGNAVTDISASDGALTVTKGATFLTEITSYDVTTALGYTPYDASNPNGYTSNNGTVTSVAVKMNDEVKGTITDNGTIDLGTVITEHQDISGKQNKLTAGANITIDEDTNIISAISSAEVVKISEAEYNANKDYYDNLDQLVYIYDIGILYKATSIQYDNTTSLLDAENVQEALDELSSGKQDKLTAGDNIAIDKDNVISANINATVSVSIPTTITDSANESITALDVLGNSTQNGTPTPSAPIEIVDASKEITSSDGTNSNKITLPYTLRSVGDIKDEIIINEDDTGSYIQRVGTVDLGTLNWRVYSTSRNNCLTSDDLNTKALSDILCSIYTSQKGKTLTNMDDYGAKPDNSEDGHIYVKDSRYTDDASGFKTAMNGIILYYILATEVTTTLTVAEVSAIKALKTYKTTSVISCEVSGEMTYYEGSNIGEVIGNIDAKKQNKLTAGNNIVINESNVISADVDATASASIPATITSSASGSITSLDVVGYSSQSGTPTPSAPIEIVDADGEITSTSSDGTSNSITLPYTLRSIGDVKDELMVNEDGTGEYIQRINVFTPSSIESYGTDATNGNYCAIIPSPNIIEDDDNVIILCDRLVSESYNGRHADTTVCRIYRGSSASNYKVWIQLATGDTTFTDSATALTFAKTLTVYYVLETPIVTSLTSTQVSAILQLYTYESSSVISSELTGTLGYYLDTNNGKAIGNVDNRKQDKLVAGDNIKIEDNIISSTFGTTIAGTLSAGDTTITLTDSSITTDSMIEVFYQISGVTEPVCYNTIDVETGYITMTFDTRENDLAIKVRIS